MNYLAVCVCVYVYVSGNYLWFNIKCSRSIQRGLPIDPSVTAAFFYLLIYFVTSVTEMRKKNNN